MFDRMLLELVEPKTNGGLMLPKEISAQSVKMARVLALGPGKLKADDNTYVKTHLKTGDLVYINQIGGNPVVLPDEFDFVIPGAGSIGEDSQRCNFTKDEGIEILEMSATGNDLLLDRSKKYQLQIEESIYMKVV